VDRIELIDELRQLETEHAKLREISARLCSFCPQDNANRLCEHCDQSLIGECEEVVANTLAVLSSLLKSVFAHEERIMNSACTPAQFNTRFGAHVGDHLAFSTDLARLAQVSSGSPPHATINDLVNLTRRWVVEHAQQYDEPMIAFVAEIAHTIIQSGQQDGVASADLLQSAKKFIRELQTRSWPKGLIDDR
jgi:hemerythrin